MVLRTTSPTAPLVQVLTQDGIAQIRGAVLKALWYERMQEKVGWTLYNHQPERLPEDFPGELQRVLCRAEARWEP